MEYEGPAPQLIKSGDPRIGRRVHRTDEEFAGVIDGIFLFDDGHELFSISGENGRGRSGVEAEVIVWEEEE